VVPPIDANGESATARIAPARTARIAPARTAGDVSSRKPTRWQDARLIEIIEEAPDAVTLRLRIFSRVSTITCE
jgi:hypothetical protein